MLGDSYGSLTPPERQLLAAAPSLLDQRQWLTGKIGQSSYTELEIEQRLQEMGGGASDGRAFFYFRDASYSNPKADAGVLGWRSDDPAERQKLELLKQRIRSSGYPLVEDGLDTPQAIADQIKADLWALIDQQFPEGEQPDALEKEARKHADYRRSRTGAGQYIGGEAYIQQLERWLEAGEQQILITGESGAGKSALIANWIEAHQQTHPADVIYAHHLGCTNDANALRPLLGRLIDTASAQLLEAGVITEPLAVPEDWWELVAKVAETLQSLGRWCEQNGRQWIWVLDGLDRLDPDDHNALPWLPQNLPAGVQVVASALACPARSILTERGYTTLTIAPLASAEQEQLIQRYLQRYTKELDGGLRQQILGHKLAGSPLFLKVLLEELRQCGRHDTLKGQLDFYLSSQTIDDLYERVLERLENDGNGEAVRKVMSAIWASRAGLTETELLAITDLAPLQWAPIDLALEKAFGRNGNRLVFDHDFLRIAVKDRYLPSEEQQRHAHSELADWYGDRDGWDERDSEELPWQLLEAGRLGDLRDWLLKPWVLANLQWDRGSRETINYWLATKGEGHGELDELITDDLEVEIEKRRDDAENLIQFVDSIAALFDEAGLYREPLLKLRALSLELEEASDDRNEESMLSSLHWLAQAYSNLGNYDAALALYQRCLEAREQLLGSDHRETLRTVSEMGSLFLDKCDYKTAELYYKRDLESSNRTFGADHPETLTAIGNLSLYYIYTENYEKAKPLALSCYEGRMRLFGPKDPGTLNSLNTLGGLYSETKEFDQAEEFWIRCLEARQALLGSDHPDTLTTVHNLGSLYQDKGDFAQAEALYKRALEARERLLGREHPSTLNTLDNLAGLFQDKGDFAQAEAHYNRCLKAREGQLGPDHPDTNNTRLSLANLLSDLERYKESIPLRRLELEIAAKRDGREASGTLSSMHRLAEDLYWSDELPESEHLYREALAGRITVLGDSDGTTMDSRYVLARCLSEQERFDEAIELRRVELAWCREQHGDTDPSTLTSINGLAIDLREIGALDEAEALFRELVAGRQQVLEPGDFQIGRALGGLAKTLEESSNLKEALTYRQQTLDHRLAHEGTDAWWTNRGRLDLARVLHKLGNNSEALDQLHEFKASMARIDEPDDDDRKLISEAEELLRAVQVGKPE
jgi:tetratricopeptide (TPR) repeat protein